MARLHVAPHASAPLGGTPHHSRRRGRTLPASNNNIVVIMHAWVCRHVRYVCSYTHGFMAPQTPFMVSNATHKGAAMGARRRAQRRAAFVMRGGAWMGPWE